MMRIPIEVSARHVHLTEEHIQKLFGHPLAVLKPISQKGQFAANEVVTLHGRPPLHPPLTKGGKGGFIENVRVVGPARQASQVELSLSDCRSLGLKNIPLKVSGGVQGTPGIVIRGPKGNVILKQGVIVPARHIHCPEGKAKKYGLKNGQRVRVRVSGKRSVVFENVVVRVREGFVWSLHLDTDEANAAGVAREPVGSVLK